MAIKVCFYADFDGDEIGGGERVVASVLGGLPERFGAEVVGVSRSTSEWIASARPGTPVTLVPPISSKADIAHIVRHVAAIRASRADVLHIAHSQLYRAQYGLFAGMLLRVPTVSVVHCVLPPTNRVQRSLYRVLVRQVPVLAAVSGDAARATEEQLALPDGRVEVAHNGVDSRGYGARAVRPAGGLVIGAIGRMTHEKGFDVLIDSLPRVPDAVLYLVGDGDQRRALEHRASCLGVSDRVVFLGWSETSWTQRWRFDIVAVPSRVEGFGLVAVEAMLAATPVVATAVGGLTEVIRDGVTGLLVPPEEPAALGGALARLGADPAHRAELGRAGAQDAGRRFTREAMIATYVGMFERAAMWRPASLAPRLRALGRRPAALE